MGKLYEKISDLCRERGVTTYRMSKEAGIARSIITELKSGRSQSLSAESLQKISLYFNVPIDYLLDPSEPDPSDIPPEPLISKEQLMFALWGEQKDELSDEDLEDVKKYADMVRLRKLEEKRKMEG